ncbi:helix-turn-helix domain-containing protein [Zooshikella sp. RANM57]|uniref:AraC family transcriptional regulator n=1 Tax=Zooshikella sp. RANM57 TaxID=3425863 RepID=UPI003D6ED0E8
MSSMQIHCKSITKYQINYENLIDDIESLMSAVLSTLNISYAMIDIHSHIHSTQSIIIHTFNEYDLIHNKDEIKDTALKLNKSMYSDTEHNLLKKKQFIFSPSILLFNNETIGHLILAFQKPTLAINSIKDITHRVLFCINYTIYKHIHQKQNNISVPNTDYWIGNSKQLVNIEEFTHKVAKVNLPVFIMGETGTGKIITAYVIHYLSNRANKPFIVSNCCEWGDRNTYNELQLLINKANGGTLYLRGLDHLSDKDIKLINNLWKSNASLSINNAVNVRIIASLSSSFDNNTLNWFTYDYLFITLPCLRDRKNDIPGLIRFFLTKYSHIKQITLSEECISLLCSYHWQDNVKQLERVLSKIVVLADSFHISSDDLLKLIPNINENIFLQSPLSLQSNNNNSSSDKSSPLLSTNHARFNYPISSKSIINHILYDQPLELSHQHPAISRAVKYIINNYMRNISLSTIAESACISSSHLSFLFKKIIGCSYKQLLIQIRIEHAKKALAYHPNKKILNICLDSGFNDFSNFERTFKRVVGVSPGEYRKA